MLRLLSLMAWFESCPLACYFGSSIILYGGNPVDTANSKIWGQGASRRPWGSAFRYIWVWAQYTEEQTERAPIGRSEPIYL